MKSTTEPRLEEWRARLGKELTRIDRDPKPRFTFRLGWAESYDALFRSEFSEQSEVTALMKIALDSGRVILHARGGAGKTVLLWRLVREALDKNVLPVVVELRRWTVQGYEDWPCQEGVLARLDFLLERFATPQISRLLLDSLPGTSKLVCFDGLNEILWRTAHEILEVAEDLATRIPSLGVIVTDRLVRRHLRRSADWRLATLLPLDPDEVSRHLTNSRPAALIGTNHSSLILLQTPYFLDVALKGDEGATEAAIHEECFQRYASLNRGELDRLAQVAFDIYVRDRSRTFEASSFRSSVGTEIVDKLTAAGALTTVQDRSSFTHHLKRDYLAARYLSEHKELWNERVFDQVTFQASSFDALAMTVEMLRSSPEVDDFVRRVYDWNYYGAAYLAA